MGFWDTLGTAFFGGDGLTNNAYQQIQAPQLNAQQSQQLGTLANQQAPTVGASQLNASNMSQSRAGLASTANNLGAIASGQQQGAGQIAVNRQVGAAQAQQAAQAQAARGGNAALAQRNAARNQADIGLAGAGQAAQAQQSDQLTANQQLGSIYGNMYGQDANVANQNAQLSQQAALANQNANIQEQGVNLNALGQVTSDQATRANAEHGEAGIGGSFLNAVAGVFGGHSDARLKNNIADGQGKAMQAVQSLAPVTFAYNDPREGAGQQLGTTAQDLEKAGLGHVVVNTPGGKVVDGFKLSTANTAMIAALGNRLAQLEGGNQPPTAPAAVQSAQTAQPQYIMSVGTPRDVHPPQYDLVVGQPQDIPSPPRRDSYVLKVGTPTNLDGTPINSPVIPRDAKSGRAIGSRR